MKPELIEELMERARMVAGRCPAGSFMDVSLESAELLHLLRCARAVAELEKFELVTIVATNRKGVSIQTTRRASSSGDLLTATEAALARAKDGGA